MLKTTDCENCFPRCDRPENFSHHDLRFALDAQAGCGQQQQDRLRRLFEDCQQQGIIDVVEGDVHIHWFRYCQSMYGNGDVVARASFAALMVSLGIFSRVSGFCVQCDDQHVEPRGRDCLFFCRGDDVLAFMAAAGMSHVVNQVVSMRKPQAAA